MRFVSCAAVALATHAAAIGNNCRCPPSAQVLDWELQGHDLPADWAKRVEGSSEFYGGLGFERSAGFQIVSQSAAA